MDLYIYSPAVEGLGVVDTYSSLRWRRRYFEPGEFELHCAATADSITLLTKRNIVHRLDRKEAGTIEGIAIKETNSGDEITATGRFLSSKFDSRIITPTINFSGTAEAAMRKAVSDNAIEARPISGLTLGTLNNFSALCNFQATGKNVLDTLIKIAKSSNIGFRVRLDVPNKALIFEIYQGTDRTVTQTTRPYVLFSDTFGNIVDPEYNSNEKNYKNFAFVAGEGDGTARVIITVDQTNGEERRELWADARDLQKGTLSDADYQAQLYQRGLEKLAEARKSENFAAAAINTENFQYLTDWDLGDIVSFEKWGLLLNQRITEIEEVYENGIVTITPTCGTLLPDALNLGDDT